jgi:P27 family predicted phage terminase small subunit
MGKHERGLRELYHADPERADLLVFGRIAKPNRRGFLHGAGLAAMSAAVGEAIPFYDRMPAGLIPVALAAMRLSEVKQCSKVIAKQGPTYETTSTQGALVVKARPEVAQRSEAARHAQSLLAEFGLSPASATKVSVPKKNPANPFAKM